MNRIIFILTLSAFLFSQQAEVTNIQAAQRTDGSQIVDIYYDLLPDVIFQVFTVTVQVSFDNGNSFSQLTDISGNFGEGIVASTDSLHHVIWNIGEQYPNIFFENVIIKILAESIMNTETPFEMVTIPSGSFDNCGTEDEINYDYNIMINAVTNAQFAEFLINLLENNEIVVSGFDGGQGVIGYYEGDENFSPGNYNYYYLEDSPFITWNGTTFIVQEGAGQSPAVFVSWFGAKVFADYYGLRIPLIKEWRKASDSILIGNNPYNNEGMSELISDIILNEDWSWGDNPIYWDWTNTVYCTSENCNGCSLANYNMNYGEHRVGFRCVAN